MRRYGTGGEEWGCGAGSFDVFLKGGGVWERASGVVKQTQTFIDRGWPVEAARVWDFGTRAADITNLVAATAGGDGRGYSGGVSNVGKCEAEGVEDVYFATSHARTGGCVQVSCGSVNGELKVCVHPVTPFVSEEEGEWCANRFREGIVRIAEGGEMEGEWGTPPPEGTRASAPDKFPLLAVAVATLPVPFVLYYDAFADFVAAVQTLQERASPADFKAVVNFWVFFAVAHPVLQPVLWISEVMHGSSGGRVGGLVPAAFLAGNAAVIWVLSKFKEVGRAVNVLAVSAFFMYVGAGLAGDGGLGDYNLQLDDAYKGTAVKGCPAYEDVRQPSMDKFDIGKYQGKWYEHGFHDWTQFKEVYDTTLDIKVTGGGTGWIDDFGVRGPSPKSSPLSWDKSPVANRAHYFMSGRVDDNDPVGVLREKGFGVEFPNYIVDVLEDEKGGYKEAIQFQCLERGGVRVFEGINFLSRNEVMTDGEWGAMHDRATKAGMDKYGADRTQMHRVERRLASEGSVDDGHWQKFWDDIGVGKLLELLTKSIEDDSREAKS